MIRSMCRRRGGVLPERKCLARRSVDVLCLALECYRLENGQLPQTLGKLVPDYLSGIPLDEFDGGPLKYSRDQKIVYSVGEDGIDAHGAKKADGYVDIVRELF
jgi:hypothetical protein